jgi:pimeloyl-ACP methyl ester carboxylesterase
MESTSKKTGLFLHMGPGFHSLIEAQLLARHWPHLEYWNQPLISEPFAAFKQLVDASKTKVNELYSYTGEPIQLVAHSFGGHIATQILREMPEKIESCDFYSTGYNIPESFYSLLQHLQKDSATEAGLKNQIDIFIKSKNGEAPNKSEIWSYLTLISQDPTFFRFYWPTAELFQKYISFAANTPATDILTFQNVLNDFLDQHFQIENLKPVKWSGKINFHLGDQDPLLLLDSETKIWKTLYPQAEFNILKTSGHFIHLENFLL